MLSDKQYPDPQSFPSHNNDDDSDDEWGNYKDWEDNGWHYTDNEVESKPPEEEEEEEEEGEEDWEEDKGKSWGKRENHMEKSFDDLNPGYKGGIAGKRGDPKYQLWFWHANSDRPHWAKSNEEEEEEEKEEEERRWRAPDWVEETDGQG